MRTLAGPLSGLPRKMKFVDAFEVNFVLSQTEFVGSQNNGNKRVRHVEYEIVSRLWFRIRVDR